jgi:hypothetical protein
MSENDPESAKWDKEAIRDGRLRSCGKGRQNPQQGMEGAKKNLSAS